MGKSSDGEVPNYSVFFLLFDFAEKAARKRHLLQAVEEKFFDVLMRIVAQNQGERYQGITNGEPAVSAILSS